MTTTTSLFAIYFAPDRADLHKSEGYPYTQAGTHQLRLAGISFLGRSNRALIGLNWAGNQYPWTSAGAIVPIVLGIIFLAIFVAWETCTKVKSALVDKRLMTSMKA